MHFMARICLGLVYTMTVHIHYSSSHWLPLKFSLAMEWILIIFDIDAYLV